MHLVVVHNWQLEEPAVATIIAEVLGTVAFEARQKISGGGPAVIASFADPLQAEALVVALTQNSVPAFVLDPEVVRGGTQLFRVRRFTLGEQALKLESCDGEFCDVEYKTIDLLLLAICKAGELQAIGTETTRKFSLGKTLLAGGVPMTKKVSTEKAVTVAEHDEALWLYTQQKDTVVFGRTVLNYDGLGEAMQLTRELNFSFLKSELRRLAPQALYDDRLLKRAALVRVIGASLNPDTDFDLAFEILARSLRDSSALDR
jgi:hypothetical protein